MAHVHRWAARHVAERLPELIDQPAEASVLAGGPPDHKLIAFYRQGHAALVAVLRAADPGVPCATFMPAPSPLAFWARRQAHETAVHGYDARSAGPGGPPDPVAALDPDFAADGLDELITGLAAGAFSRRGGGPRSLVIRLDDVPGRWRVRLGGGTTEVSSDYADLGEAADCALDGPAAGLYTFLWNRCDAGRGRVTVTGDPAVVALWRQVVRVTF
jgi:uncharacterized protein (TIGR03083 family)